MWGQCCRRIPGRYKVRHERCADFLAGGRLPEGPGRGPLLPILCGRSSAGRVARNEVDGRPLLGRDPVHGRAVEAGVSGQNSDSVFAAWPSGGTIRVFARGSDTSEVRRQWTCKFIVWRPVLVVNH